MPCLPGAHLLHLSRKCGSAWRLASVQETHTPRAVQCTIEDSLDEQQEPTVTEINMPWSTPLQSADYETMKAMASTGWDEEIVKQIQEYWAARGVSNEYALERLTDLALRNPRLRNLEFVRARMARWDAALADYKIDTNRIALDDEHTVQRLPSNWVSRLVKLKTKYPEVCWEKVMEEVPSMGFVPYRHVVQALNQWAAAHMPSQVYY